MVFELITGDYLFDPKKGKTFKKNDDHLALISELIGEMNSKEIEHYKENAEQWDHYFMPTNKNKTKFKLERIKSLKPWPLIRVLTEKYRIKETEANLLSKFLMRMLRWVPGDRPTARDLLSDSWLKVSPLDTHSHMTKAYQNEWLLATGEKGLTSSSEGDSKSE